MKIQLAKEPKWFAPVVVITSEGGRSYCLQPPESMVLSELFETLWRRQAKNS